MARVPLIEPDNAGAEAAALLGRIAGARGKAFNVYRALANSPGALRVVYELGSFLWNESVLPAALRELVILRVARLTGSSYEWSRHLALARSAGVTDEQLEALDDWWRAPGTVFAAEQRSALAVADELTLGGEVGEVAIERAIAELGPQGAVELLVLAGFYAMVAGVLTSLQVDAEPGDEELPPMRSEDGIALTRIVTDDGGETHFEDFHLAASVADSQVSDARSELSDPLPVSALRLRRVVVEHGSEPHVAPCRQLVVHLRGRAAVTVSDGETRRLGPGSVVLVEDLDGARHVTRRVGAEMRETMMIELVEGGRGVVSWT